eukprot:SAG22_NODE_14760_length_365_cov_1.552632_1_plen_67_part_01
MRAQRKRTAERVQRCAKSVSLSPGAFVGIDFVRVKLSAGPVPRKMRCCVSKARALPAFIDEGLQVRA